MAVELDYMEYINDGAAQAAYISDADMNPAVWDLLDEDCVAIGDWNDDDVGVGVSEVSPAGQFRFDTNAGAAGNARAGRSRDIGSFPNTFTVEVKLYHDAIGTKELSDHFIISCAQADERFYVVFDSNGLFVHDTDDGYTEVGSGLVKQGGSAEWQTWRFLVTFTGVTGEGTCDVYLNDSTHNWEKVGTAIPCSREGAEIDGTIEITQRGNTTDDRVTHMDHIKIYDGLAAPVLNLQCYSEDTIKQQGTYSLKVIAASVDSLNDTLTKTLVGGDKIDLSGIDTLKVYVYASRSGTNIEIRIHDSGGTTTTKSIVISSTGTWEQTTWDISGVADANKDDIDSIIIKVTNADAENIFYVDDFYGVEISAYPVAALNKNRISGYHCFLDAYMRAKRAGLEPLKLPDGTIF